VSVLEGGYSKEAMTRGVATHLEALADVKPPAHPPANAARVDED
jgi:acetoin utilization deacetylase AcuC-like enzyme